MVVGRSEDKFGFGFVSSWMRVGGDEAMSSDLGNVSFSLLEFDVNIWVLVSVFEDWDISEHLAYATVLKLVLVYYLLITAPTS